MSSGVYLFCLTPGTPLPELAGTGIDGLSPLVAEPVAGVVAITAAVSLEDFRGPEARARLADLAWVAPRARRHEEVILSILRQAPVLPVRFGSVFSGLAALAAALEPHRAALAGFFLETAGQQEWALKAYVDLPAARARLLATRLATEQAQLAGLPPGKRYFQEQKIKTQVDLEMRAWLRGVTDEITALVAPVSTTTAAGRLLAADLTGRADEMIYHAALLVRVEDVERLHGLTAVWNAGHASLGLQLEASGPWPPYHFTPVLNTQG